MGEKLGSWMKEVKGGEGSRREPQIIIKTDVVSA